MHETHTDLINHRGTHTQRLWRGGQQQKRQRPRPNKLVPLFVMLGQEGGGGGQSIVPLLIEYNFGCECQSEHVVFGPELHGSVDFPQM